MRRHRAGHVFLFCHKHDSSIKTIVIIAMVIENTEWDAVGRRSCGPSAHEFDKNK